ncbi:hypothetical protein [Pantanalinema sp. GBBB05]|uniref:hypothetical protein n=1 Tax=Pantanalinema sp. GBBB05 TaxID=2604139 RepID=UPI001D7520AC|nr:hypothetical protein [Pantanalinema sp. GBBB05]
MSKPQTERFYASPETMRHLLDMGREALIEWEKSGRIQQRVHFVLVNGHRRYCVPLMLDRLANWDDDAAHQAAVENWVKALPSNQKKLKLPG